ncbi:MAG: FHA domain-containing protein [Alcanivoracaceae bacterium]|nr:FHA domain-containing protein [Alcanivoracaceae bacterium]
MLKLQFKDKRKAAIWLVDSRYAIGRDKSNDIVFDEEGVSGFHAELRVEDDDRVFVTDAGSINGTFVNGKQIKARTQLRPNDVIRVHRAELTLVDPKEQLKVQPPEDAATAMTPALQGLNVGSGVGGVPTGWLLRAKTGSVSGQVFKIPASGRAILGRSQSCDIVITGTHVSRQHAELYFQSGKLHVKDLGSSNGTYVNRKKVDDAVVNAGDEIRFDTLVFQVEAPANAAPVTPAAPSEGADSTMFRPAAAAPAPKPAASQPARRVAPSQPPVAQPKSSSSATIVLVVVVVAALGGAAAWFLM